MISLQEYLESNQEEYKLPQRSIVKSFSFPDGEIRGDMFYIKHNSNNFTVIDCYLKDGDDRSARKEEIVKEIVVESKGRVCRFISTHPDNDHIAGIEYLDEKWPIKNFYAVENERPDEEGNKSLEHYHKLLKEHNCPIKLDLSRAWLNTTTKERKGSNIFFYWPDLKNEKFKERLKAVSENKEINSICPIFTYQPEIGASFMWMGDLKQDMQEEFCNKYVDDIPHVDVLFHPHHGRKKDALPNELLELLDPKIIVIGNAPKKDLNYAHPEKTITQNTAGDIVFIVDDAKLHVYTSNEVDNKPTCLKIDHSLKSYDRKYGYYMGTLIL